jgi:hypothetical protein
MRRPEALQTSDQTSAWVFRPGFNSSLCFLKASRSRSYGMSVCDRLRYRSVVSEPVRSVASTPSESKNTALIRAAFDGGRGRGACIPMFLSELGLPRQPARGGRSSLPAAIAQRVSLPGRTAQIAFLAIRQLG